MKNLIQAISLSLLCVSLPSLCSTNQQQTPSMPRMQADSLSRARNHANAARSSIERLSNQDVKARFTELFLEISRSHSNHSINDEVAAQRYRDLNFQILTFWQHQMRQSIDSRTGQSFLAGLDE